MRRKPFRLCLQHVQRRNPQPDRWSLPNGQRIGFYSFQGLRPPQHQTGERSHLTVDPFENRGFRSNDAHFDAGQFLYEQRSQNIAKHASAGNSSADG